MTQEDKKLLLKYLCMALPHGVAVYCGKDMAMTLRQIDYEGFCVSWVNEDIKSHSRWNRPYLRPMSSMTEEEKEEYKKLIWTRLEHHVVIWLLKNHFDFMGLIPKNLAIEVTEDNNPYKE